MIKLAQHVGQPAPASPRVLMLLADKITFPGRHHTLVEPTTLEVARGDLLLVQGDNADERTAAALILSGRMKPRSGRLSWDGYRSPNALRHASALLDAPEINEPEPFMTVADLVDEELALIPRPAWRRSERAGSWLARQDMDDVANLHFQELTAAQRLDILVRLALTDKNVALIVCDSPDRHDATDSTWLTHLEATLADHPVAAIALVAVIPSTWSGPTTRLGEVLEGPAA